MKAPIKLGELLTNNELTSLFRCSNQGWMRRSHMTNALVIVSDHTKDLYDDREVNGIFKYTGEGMTGDQDIDKRQNKTLKDSDTNGVEVHFFEVEEKGKYKYRGRVELAGEPFQETQLDINKNERLVWVFPLKFVNE